MCAPSEGNATVRSVRLVVSHVILLDKLSRLGLPNFIIEWITAFLCDRKHRVKIGHEKSEWAGMNARVPQGTLLGPVGFLFHVNDLKTSCDTIKYINDSSVGVLFSNWHGQQAINSCRWSQRLVFCKPHDAELWQNKGTVCFARIPLEVSPVVIESRKIKVVFSATLLGVVFSGNLKRQAHVDHITSKAAQRLYSLSLLKRAAVDPKSLVRVYVALVHPMVEYTCQVWHTGLTRDQSKQLESIQHRALDIVFLDTTYRQACGLAKLVTGEEHRENACRTFFQAMQRANLRLHHLLPAVQRQGAWR